MTDIFTSPRRFTDLRSWHLDADRLRADGSMHRIEQPGWGGTVSLPIGYRLR